jgi:hypothetical protein
MSSTWSAESIVPLYTLGSGCTRELLLMDKYGLAKPSGP